MPIERLVLILVCVIVAAALTIWVGAVLLAAWNVPIVGFALIPVALIAYVVARVIGERVGNTQEDHYDRMDH